MSYHSSNGPLLHVSLWRNKQLLCFEQTSKEYLEKQMAEVENNLSSVDCFFPFSFCRENVSSAWTKWIQLNHDLLGIWNWIDACSDESSPVSVCIFVCGQVYLGAKVSFNEWTRAEAQG